MSQPILAVPRAAIPFVIAYEPPLEQSIKSAENLKLQGKYKEAVSSYERLIAKSPRNIELYIRLIKVHFFFEQYEKASNAANKACYLNPNNPEVLFLRGRIFQEQKKYGVAILAYERALEQANISPDTKKRVCLYLGTAYEETNNLDKAFYFVNKALEVDPNFQMAKNNLGSYYISYPGNNWQPWYLKGIEVYKTMDQKKLLMELAALHYDRQNTLVLALELEKRIGSSKDYNFIKGILLGYPKEKTPYVLNAFWQYFIKYVPDSPGDEKDRFLDPQITIARRYGGCDDAVSFFNCFFKFKNIEFNNILSSYASDRNHVVCSFTLDGKKWNSIDSDGLH